MPNPPTARTIRIIVIASPDRLLLELKRVNISVIELRL